VALWLAHAFAEISDGAASKLSQLRCRYLVLATLRLSILELRQPQVQLAAILGKLDVWRESGDGPRIFGHPDAALRA
jgi:hypothetical protein